MDKLFIIKIIVMNEFIFVGFINFIYEYYLFTYNLQNVLLNKL